MNNQQTTSIQSVHDGIISYIQVQIGFFMLCMHLYSLFKRVGWNTISKMVEDAQLNYTL